MPSTDTVAARTLTFVLAGGEGRRLRPLTKYRPKPLLPFGGRYRIIDFTLSNCLNSDIRRAIVLTQCESESIEAYLRKGWCRVGRGSREFVVPSPPAAGRRYAGSADAVLQNLAFLEHNDCSFALVLCAGNIYNMDYRDILRFHAASGAEVTIARANDPQEPANMGVYVFNRDVLLSIRGSGTITDLANDLLPRVVASCDVRVYRHEDRIKKTPLYSTDIGTPEAYYEANMDLLASVPRLDPYDNRWPIRSGDRASLDGRNAFSELGRDSDINSIIPNGANIGRASVYRSVLFPGVVLESGADVRHSVLMPGVVIERGALIRRAIIDANVVIDANDEIGYNSDRDRRRFHVLANGVVVVSPEHISPFCDADAACGSTACRPAFGWRKDRKGDSVL